MSRPYHRLFADLLRQRLRTVGVPEPVSLLHERASRWYQAHGFPAGLVAQQSLGRGERALTEAQHAASRSGNDYVQCAARVFLSRVQQAHGKLRQAAAACRQIVERSGQLPITALAHYDLVRLHYEWNDLATATNHLKRGLELSQRGGGVKFLSRVTLRRRSSGRLEVQPLKPRPRSVKPTS